MSFIGNTINIIHIVRNSETFFAMNTTRTKLLTIFNTGNQPTNKQKERYKNDHNDDSSI